MATHSSVLAWKIPWTEEPGGLRGVAESRTRLSDEHSNMLSLVLRWQQGAKVRKAGRS